jgi:hypothetical protein
MSTAAPSANISSDISLRDSNKDKLSTPAQTYLKVGYLALIPLPRRGMFMQ